MNGLIILKMEDMMEEVTINGTSFYVGLTDVYGGKVWFYCKWLENHLRTIDNKIIKREVLALLHKIHGRAVCYAR